MSADKLAEAALQVVAAMPSSINDDLYQWAIDASEMLRDMAAALATHSAEQAQAAPPAPRTLSPEEIDRIHDSIECWDGYGLGAKFNHQAFARAVLAAAEFELGDV